ncbi:fimbrial protein [Gibbsiella greigii]
MRIITKSAMAAFISSALSLLPTLTYAAVTVDGGTLNFEGSVVTTACALSSSSATQSINMGQVGTPNLATAGTTLSTGKEFTIQLTDCDTSVYTNIAITFTGVADANDPTTLAVGVAGNSTYAQNLGIRFFNSSGTQVKLNEASTATALTGGSNILTFTAKYHTEKGSVTAGDASAVATYTLTYS